MNCADPNCRHFLILHRAELAAGKPVREVVGRCGVDGCKCQKFVAENGAGSVTISPADEKFARSLIGQCQQVILKEQRKIEDIKRHFGLKE